jgi:hypothetical protein
MSFRRTVLVQIVVSIPLRLSLISLSVETNILPSVVLVVRVGFLLGVLIHHLKLLDWFIVDLLGLLIIIVR